MDTLRDAVFAKVAQRAIRNVSLKTFRHLHKLALRFHLERQTGGLSRAIERGTKGIDFLLTFMLFNIIPTLLEISLVCGILWYLFNIWYALVTFVTIASYIGYTLAITEWRLKYRRRMNESDQEANTRAIDSLLNYETVKYFGNEDYEANRFDQSLARYERAAVTSKSSLALLNIGQASIIGVGLTIVMAMAGQGMLAGTMTIGDFVLVNTYLLQLYMPLNFLGFVYREIKQSLTDMEAMFHLLEVTIGETVKYFGNEDYEANRFDQSLARYERAAVTSKSSLALLNIGQASIIGVGLTIVMAMAGQGMLAGTMTIGDFVLVNTYLLQLYMPLNFLGFVYREIKQSLTDMEAMFHLLDGHIA